MSILDTNLPAFQPFNSLYPGIHEIIVKHCDLRTQTRLTMVSKSWSKHPAISGERRLQQKKGKLSLM
jgi:hypothetical protein